MSIQSTGNGDEETRTVEACPECKSSGFRVRNTGQIDNTRNERYKCRNPECGAYFDEPIRREQRVGNDSILSGLAHELETMDADAI